MYTLIAICIVILATIITWEVSGVRKPIVKFFEGDVVTVQRSASSTAPLPEAEARIEFYMESQQGQEQLRLWAEKQYISEQEKDIERRKEELREQELGLL